MCVVYVFVVCVCVCVCVCTVYVCVVCVCVVCAHLYVCIEDLHPYFGCLLSIVSVIGSLPFMTTTLLALQPRCPLGTRGGAIAMDIPGAIVLWARVHATQDTSPSSKRVCR